MRVGGNPKSKSIPADWSFIVPKLWTVVRLEQQSSAMCMYLPFSLVDSMLLRFVTVVISAFICVSFVRITVKVHSGKGFVDLRGPHLDMQTQSHQSSLSGTRAGVRLHVNSSPGRSVTRPPRSVREDQSFQSALQVFPVLPQQR